LSYRVLQQLFAFSSFLHLHQRFPCLPEGPPQVCCDSFAAKQVAWHQGPCLLFAAYYSSFALI
jgi:hypothetical protein